MISFSFLTLNKNFKNSFTTFSYRSGLAPYPDCKGRGFYFVDRPVDAPNSLSEKYVNDAGQVNETKHGGIIALALI